MKSIKKIILKYIYKNGFTLVELLAVIVILAVIMIVAIPSVLTVMQTARKKSFVEYATKVYNASNQKYAADLLVESQPSCVIYDIVNDLDLSNVGSYKGYVAVSKDTGVVKYYITLYDEDYMLVAYNYSDKKNNKLEEVGIDDSLLEYNEEDKDTVLTVEYLASFSTNSCVYTVINPDGSKETKIVDGGEPVRKDISTLNTGEQVNYLWKKLVNDAAESWKTKDSNIKHIVKTSEAPADGVSTVVISNGNDKQEETVSWYQDGTIYVYSKANHIYANNDSSYLFIYFEGLEDIDLSIFDFSNTEKFTFMIYGAVQLTSIDLTKINTSNAKDLGGFIEHCSNLSNIIGYENLDVSKCEDIAGFFAYLPKITSLDLSKWDVSNVDSISSIFAGCTNLTSVNISNWDTSNVLYMQYLFDECENITSIDVSNWNTSKVIYMAFVFEGCKKLSSINVSNWNTSNVVYMNGLFYDCENLTSLDLSKWDVSKVASFYNTFSNCVRLTNLNISGWNTSSAQTMSGMFHNCTSLETLDVSSFNTSNVLTLDHMFNTDDSVPFSTNYGKLKALDLSNWDVSNVQYLDWFLEDQRFITVLDLSNWNTSNCTSFNHMFSGMHNLKTIYASTNFKFKSGAQYLDKIFYECKAIVGGNGTTYDSKKVSSKYGVIDNASHKGYFTKKE